MFVDRSVKYTKLFCNNVFRKPWLKAWDSGSLFHAHLGASYDMQGGARDLFLSPRVPQIEGDLLDIKEGEPVNQNNTYMFGNRS